jgi:hypothetical protein
MSETVLLIGMCERRHHVMFQVLETPDGPVIHAPRYCAGRESGTWTPKRRRLDLTRNRVSRYGCACRATALIGDREMWDRIQRGNSKWRIATTNIG